MDLLQRYALALACFLLMLQSFGVSAQDYSKEENGGGGGDIRVNVPHDFSLAPSDFMQDLINFKDIPVAGVDYVLGPQGPPPEESSSSDDPPPEERTPPAQSHEDRRQATEPRGRPFQGFQMRQPSDVASSSSSDQDEAEKYRKRMHRDPPPPDPAHLKDSPRQSSYEQQSQRPYYQSNQEPYKGSEQSYSSQDQSPYKDQSSYTGSAQSYNSPTQGYPSEGSYSSAPQSYSSQTRAYPSEEPPYKEQSYDSTSQNYNAPSQNYNAQSQNYNSPSQNYDAPSQSYKQSSAQPSRYAEERQPYRGSAQTYSTQPQPYGTQPPPSTYAPYQGNRRSDYSQNSQSQAFNFPEVRSTAQPTVNRREAVRVPSVELPDVSYGVQEGTSDHFQRAPGSLDSLLKVSPAIFDSIGTKQQAETRTEQTTFQSRPRQNEDISRQDRGSGNYGSSYDVPIVWRSGTPNNDNDNDNSQSYQRSPSLYQSSSSPNRGSGNNYGTSYDVPVVWRSGTPLQQSQGGQQYESSNESPSNQKQAPPEIIPRSAYPDPPRRPEYPSFQIRGSQRDSRTLYPSDIKYPDEIMRRSEVDSSTPGYSATDEKPFIQAQTKVDNFFRSNKDAQKERVKRNAVRLLTQKVSKSESNPGVVKVFRAYGTSNDSLVLSDARLRVDKTGRPVHLLLRTSTPVQPSVQQDKGQPACAAKSPVPLCLTDDEYPSEDVTAALMKNPGLLVKLRQLAIPPVNTSGSNLTSGQPGFGRPSSAASCASLLTTQFPKRARNANGLWKTIVNVEAFKQPVVMEICRSMNQSCSASSLGDATKKDSTPPRRCIQRWSLVRLVSFQPARGLAVDKFRFPASCACDISSP